MQGDQFATTPMPGSNTTAIYPNRIQDKARVEKLIGLPEVPQIPGETFEFFTPAGTLFARTWVRVVYGDHGYCQLAPNGLH